MVFTVSNADSPRIWYNDERKPHQVTCAQSKQRKFRLLTDQCHRNACSDISGIFTSMSLSSVNGNRMFPNIRYTLDGIVVVLRSTLEELWYIYVGRHFCNGNPGINNK